MRAQNVELIYHNFSDVNNPKGRLKNIVFIKDLQSVSFTLPYFFRGEGIHDLPSNGKTVEKLFVKASDTVRRYVFKNLGKNEMFFESDLDMIFREAKVFSDTLHNFSWIISGEVKKIDSFACVKATTTWRGRNYTAWFTESIPVSNGPWKFGGLPGLIVEIYDTDKVSYWRLAQIRQTSVFVLPPFPEKTDGTFSDFKAEFYKKYLRIKRSIEGHDGVSDPNCAGCTGSTTFTVNTPERLTEQ